MRLFEIFQKLQGPNSDESAAMLCICVCVWGGGGWLHQLHVFPPADHLTSDSGVTFYDKNFIRRTSIIQLPKYWIGLRVGGEAENEQLLVVRKQIRCCTASLPLLRVYMSSNDATSACVPVPSVPHTLTACVNHINHPESLDAYPPIRPSDRLRYLHP